MESHSENFGDVEKKENLKMELTNLEMEKVLNDELNVKVVHRSHFVFFITTSHFKCIFLGILVDCRRRNK